MKHYKKALKMILKALWETIKLIFSEIYHGLTVGGQYIDAWVLRHKIDSYINLATTTFAIGISMLFMLVQFSKWPVTLVMFKTVPMPTDFVEIIWHFTPFANLFLVPIGLMGFAFGVHELLTKWHGPIIGLVDGLDLEERIANVANSDNGYNLVPMLVSAYSTLEDTNKSLRSEVRELKHHREKQGVKAR